MSSKKVQVDFKKLHAMLEAVQKVVDAARSLRERDSAQGYTEVHVADLQALKTAINLMDYSS